MTQNDFSKMIFQSYGAVTRARGCFLYTKKGVRLTDLFLENGRAILGWEGGSAFTYFKNILSKGLTGSFFCEDRENPKRIDRAVSDLLKSERKVFFFHTKMEALKTGLLFSPDSTCVYKPWSGEEGIYSKSKCVIIQPPLPWTNSLFILAVQIDAKLSDINKSLSAEEGSCDGENSCSKNSGINAQLAAGLISEKIPFALETAVTRAIYNLIAEIPARQEKDWFIYDTVLTKYWERKGPYLFPKVPEEKYEAFVKHCLKMEIAVNPDYNGFSIVPFGADKGVFTKLKNSPFVF